MVNKEIIIGNLISEKNTVKFGSISISEIYDGSSISVPVVVINGKYDGPTIWLQNGVHGDEYVGMRAIHLLIERIKPEDVHGAIILIPMLNIQAFRAGTRMAPQDGLDMNRIWPGAPMEKVMHLFAHSELVVHNIFQYIKKYADCLIDIHDCGRMGNIAPYAAFYADQKKSGQNKELALASGMEIIWETQPVWVEEKVPGSIKSQMLKLGRPSITVEVGGEGRLREVDVNKMYHALVNCIKFMNILEGGPEKFTGKQKYIKEGNWLRPKHGGPLLMLVEVAEEVSKGQPIAIITDLYGKEVEKLVSPVDGIVIGCRTLGMVATGQYTCNVGSREERR